MTIITQSRALLASSVVPISARNVLNIIVIENTINVTSDVSYAKPTIALKLTHHFNVPVVIWTVGQTNAMKTTKKYRYIKRGQIKENPVGHPNVKSGGNAPHVTK